MEMPASWAGSSKDAAVRSHHHAEVSILKTQLPLSHCVPVDNLSARAQETLDSQARLGGTMSLVCH